ncbi:uncharacterized protein LOC114525960 [Dendronephthya gigantea]|uniref:uncharacterized protein LOC114525960 n=1 Tax=Dendronephthya gigantea TaxID=151771 RepID=UPI00106C7665|nr:uncharacterized protein LOC114525960 [Dendronephthya gigantea]
MFVVSLSTLTFVAYSLLLMHRTTARSTKESQPTARSTNKSQPTARSTKESQPTARSTKKSQPTARSTNESQPTIHLPRNISNETTIVTRSNLNETECKMSIKEEDWKKFLTLTEHSLVNIVDLHFVVDDNHTKYTRSMIWVNRVGGKLLLLLDIESFSTTLNVGRRNMKMHVETQPKECVWFNNTEQNYQVETKLLNIFGLKIKPSEELCFTLRPNAKKPRQCCKVTRTGVNKEEYECYLSLGPPFV